MQQSGAQEADRGARGSSYKGSGFYITDYKNKAPGKAEGGEGKVSADSKGGSEAKPGGDGKPAAPVSAPPAKTTSPAPESSK